MLQELKSRNEYLDFAKAIGICLVVLGHTFGGGLFALKTYHMPFFFFVSGLLLDDKENIQVFLIKRVCRLYIPFLIYEVFLLGIHNFLYDFGIVSNCYILPQDIFHQLVHIICFDNCEILLAPTWFVTVLFWAGIISRIILSFSVRNSIYLKKESFAVVGFLLSSCLIYVGMLNGSKGRWNVSRSFNCPQVINITFIATGYILIGYLCKCFKMRFSKEKSEWKQILIIILFAGVVCFERRTKLISDMRANVYTYISLAPLFALIGISMIFFVAQYLLRAVEWAHLKRAKRLILYAGQHTFTIMCLHPIAFKLIGWIGVNLFGYDKQLLLDWGVVGYNVLWLALDCVAGILIPLAGSWLFKKVLLYGK